jgi:hypothetical protein
MNVMCKSLEIAVSCAHSHALLSRSIPSMIRFNNAAASETAAEFDVLCVDCDALCEVDGTAPALSYTSLCGFDLGIPQLSLLSQSGIVQYEVVR